MYKPYSIITPPYDPTSGGIKVMWGLYGWLLAKGQIVYPNAQIPNNDFIAIYPEIYHGNPAGAQTVIRYLLNKPGVMGSRDANGAVTPGPTSFDPTDRLYYFSKLFAEGEVPEDHFLFLPIIDLHIFKDQHKKRNKKAVFFGKGGDLGLHPKDCIVIDRQVAQDQTELNNILNECEVMYCYDPVTAMTEVARLAGCRVVIFPSTYNKDQYSMYEPGMNGVSWGIDTKNELDIEEFRTHYASLRVVFENHLDKFIDDTQK